MLLEPVRFFFTPIILTQGRLTMSVNEGDNSFVISRATFKGIVSDPIERLIDAWRWVAGAKNVIDALLMELMSTPLSSKRWRQGQQAGQENLGTYHVLIFVQVSSLVMGLFYWARW